MNTPANPISTVGGSHVPIVRAILESRADYVCFLCTGPDPETGKAGSNVQIEGKGIFIKARPDDPMPTLPNIPTQCGLSAEQFELRRVPSDDLDAIYDVCRAALHDLRQRQHSAPPPSGGRPGGGNAPDVSLSLPPTPSRREGERTVTHQRHPGMRIVADYTGGTKSMSAALVLAAIDAEGVALQLVTGNRVDLVRVRDGAENAAPANIEAIRLERRMQPYLNAWERHAYAEAEAGLRGLPTPGNAALRGQLNRARDLSAAFAAWDAFDHATARDRLQGYAARLPEDWKPLLGALRALADADPVKRQAAQLFDLYRNAERRFAQGRHDDGVARLYRLLEWTAQWLLEKRCQVKTGDLPADWAPHIAPNRNGQRQAGLFEAWRLVAERTPGPLAAWHKEHRETMLDHLNARNASILAHGFAPVTAATGQQFLDWLAGEFLTALLAETATVGIRQLPPQWPSRYA